MNEIENHITRKYNFILKQIDAQRESYFISTKHVFTMRGWCLTAFVAYFGFITNVTKEYYLIHPGMIICFSFWILEAFVRYGMKTMLDNIVEMIKLIDTKDVSDFNKAIEEYQIVKKEEGFSNDDLQLFKNFKRR